MSFLSQAPPLGGLSPPHGAFQEHAAHAREWSMALSSKGSLGTCIPKGVSTFFHTAFTAHSEARAKAVGVGSSAWLAGSVSNEGISDRREGLSPRQTASGGRRRCQSVSC